MINDGVYTIRAWTTDSSNNESLRRERMIVIDQKNPDAPDIIVSGKHGPNEDDTTYIGAVSVAITPRSRYYIRSMGNRI